MFGKAGKEWNVWVNQMHQGDPKESMGRGSDFGKSREELEKDKEAIRKKEEEQLKKDLKIVPKMSPPP